MTILNRTIVLTLLLVLSLAGVGLKIYWMWHTGPWDLPTSAKPAAADRADAKTTNSAAPPVVGGTDAIIGKNLFDPERGANRNAAAEQDTHGAQRIRNMILLGTAILGSTRYAIVQDGEAASRPPAGTPPSAQGPQRLKLGDTIDGFSLTEIGEKAVVFAKGPTRVEIPIDYFRKVPVAAARTTPQSGPPRPPGPNVPGQVQPGTQPAQPAPGIGPRPIPNRPRRSRLPSAPAQ